MSVSRDRVGTCFLGGEEARSQQGAFRGERTTRDLVGPFDGEQGTRGW